MQAATCVPIYHTELLLHKGADVIDSIGEQLDAKLTYNLKIIYIARAWGRCKLKNKDEETALVWWYWGYSACFTD